jgi:hypothetical protein
MGTRAESIAWAGTFLILAVFAVPWFLWGDDTTWGGLPLWLWWHVAWLALTTVVFYVFSRTGWGLWTGVEA